MKFSHMVTIFILVMIVASAVTSVIAKNWGELGMCITAFGGWMMIAKQEFDERQNSETVSR